METTIGTDEFNTGVTVPNGLPELPQMLESLIAEREKLMEESNARMQKIEEERLKLITDTNTALGKIDGKLEMLKIWMGSLNGNS